MIVALAAAAAAACGSSDVSSTSPCGLDKATADRARPVAAAADAPSVAVLVTRSLQNARASYAVHFRLTASFEAEAPESYLRRLSDPLTGNRAGDSFVNLARDPICVFAEGDRSADGFWARIAIESEDKVKRYEVRQADGRLYIRLHGVWSDFVRPFGELFATETFGALVPGAACFAEVSEGCDRVDFGPALESGKIGKLIDGHVGSRGSVWQVSGTLDPQAFSEFAEGAPPTTYEPYARSGRIVFSAGKSHRFPRELDVRYDFDRADIQAHSGSSAGAFTRRRGHVNIQLSRWGEAMSFTAPTASRVTNKVAAELFGGFLRAASLHY